MGSACSSKGSILAGRQTRRAFGLAFAIVAMMASSACSASVSKKTAAVAFQCSVSGLDSAKTGLSADMVCADFKSRIDQARGAASEAVKTLSMASDHDWIALEIRVSQGRSAAAVLTRKMGAKQHVYPEIVVDVMDKPLGKQELEKLAIEVAKLVSEDNHE